MNPDRTVRPDEHPPARDPQAMAGVTGAGSESKHSSANAHVRMDCHEVGKPGRTADPGSTQR